MSGKIFDERGFLNKEGEKAVEKLKQEVSKLLVGSDLDIQITGSILHKIVGDMVCDAIQHKRNEVNKFAAMSDEEFESYLKDKYEPLYGVHWLFKASLTEEEAKRSVESFQRRMKKAAEKLKENPPPRVNRGWIPPRGRGKYID